MHFSWDIAKATSNLRKHGVAFTEAATVFGDPLSMTRQDLDHSIHEQRYIMIGTSRSGRLLVVSHTERGDTVRIISARGATKAERRQYENS